MSEPIHLLLCSHEYSVLKLDDGNVKKKFQENVFRNTLFRHYIEDNCTKVMFTFRPEEEPFLEIGWLNFAGAPFKWSMKSVRALIASFKKHRLSTPSIDECELWKKVADGLGKKGYQVSGARCKFKMDSLKKKFLRMGRDLDNANNNKLYKLLKGIWSEEEIQNFERHEIVLEANVDEDRAKSIQSKDGEVKLPDHLEEFFYDLCKEFKIIMKTIYHDMNRLRKRRAL